MAKMHWKMVSLLGSWHKVSAQKAFRFYVRENQLGEKWFFADYRIDDLTSRFHKLGPISEGGDVCSCRANTAVLDMTREQLAELCD